jgi:hypothetical protein
MEETNIGRVIELEAALKVGFEMRKRQKEYFKTRDRETMIDAKRLEAAFDARLAALGYK